MTASDIVAIIGSLAAAVTLVINTYYSARAKNVAEETRDIAERHESLTIANIDSEEAE